MEKISRIDGREYNLIDRLPSLAGEAGYVICEDAEGKRFVCPEDLRLENVPQAEQTAPVCTHSSAQENIECFLCFVAGRGCMQGGITAPKPGKAAIHRCVKMSGRRGCAISGSTNARTVRIGHLYR